MLQVGVEHDEPIELRLAETREHGARQPAFLATDDQPNRMARAESTNEFLGAVLGIIVHDQNLDRPTGELRGGGDPRDQLLQIPRLAIGRDDDRRGSRGRSHVADDRTTLGSSKVGLLYRATKVFQGSPAWIDTAGPSRYPAPAVNVDRT